MWDGKNVKEECVDVEVRKGNWMHTETGREDLTISSARHARHLTQRQGRVPSRAWHCQPFSDYHTGKETTCIEFLIQYGPAALISSTFLL